MFGNSNFPKRYAVELRLARFCARGFFCKLGRPYKQAIFELFGPNFCDCLTSQNANIWFHFFINAPPPAVWSERTSFFQCKLNILIICFNKLFFGPFKADLLHFMVFFCFLFYPWRNWKGKTGKERPGKARSDKTRPGKARHVRWLILVFYKP